MSSHLSQEITAIIDGAKAGYPAETGADVLPRLAEGLRLAAAGGVRGLGRTGSTVWVAVADSGARAAAVRHGYIDRARRRLLSPTSDDRSMNDRCGKADATLAAAVVADAVLTWADGPDERAKVVLEAYSQLLETWAAGEGEGRRAAALEAAATVLLESLRPCPGAEIVFGAQQSRESWAVVHSTLVPSPGTGRRELLPLFTGLAELKDFIGRGGV